MTRPIANLPTALSRRSWLASAFALMAAGCAPRQRQGARPPASAASSAIETVTGPIRAETLGLTLMHEHVLVDFIGASEVTRSRYDADAVFRTVLPYLQQVRKLGCDALVECTPAYLGRDPQLLKRLSEASGVRILTNTGYYGAAKDKHLPSFAFIETAEQLAARWIREAERGLDDTSIKPAFMKIGVDEAPLSEIDVKLVRAAAITHRATGLPIASHTGTGAATMAELDLLEAELRRGVGSDELEAGGAARGRGDRDNVARALLVVITGPHIWTAHFGSSAPDRLRSGRRCRSAGAPGRPFPPRRHP